MKKFIPILSLFLVMSLPISFAENWYYAGGSDGQDIFIDNDSVVKNNQEANLQIKFVNSDGSYVIRRATFYHDSQKYKYNDEIDYNAGGAQVNYKTAQDESSSDGGLSSRLRPVSASDMSFKVYFLIW